MFNQNNLAQSSSLYLQQHKDNPVHWQEWSKEVLAFAKDNNKPILVSIGYATCHWCHVMASEAFSDKEVANFLNNNFVCIKVDREERPDIDSAFMLFCQETTGQGGWPLNIFLTPLGNPVAAITYLPVTPKFGLPGFIEYAGLVLDGMEDIPSFVPKLIKPNKVEQQAIATMILESADIEFGGFGSTKFSPYATLLYCLNHLMDNEEIKQFVELTLDTIVKSGMHDHLQGGFFRYATDPEWNIPHFEKMLYDQAMHLWVYSVAFQVYKKKEYRNVADKIVQCLEDTFIVATTVAQDVTGVGPYGVSRRIFSVAKNPSAAKEVVANKQNNFDQSNINHESILFFSAIDADTSHHEGATYLFTEQELKEILEEDYSDFQHIFAVENIHNKFHLKKKVFATNKSIEEKLLAARNKRDQPVTDKKQITSWNALAAIGLLMAYRYCDNKDALIRAKTIFTKLKSQPLTHVVGGSNVFLEDYASLLLLATYMQEEFGGEEKILAELSQKVNAYKKEFWIESKTDDFAIVPASPFDHPIPSSVAIAKLALTRAAVLQEQSYDAVTFVEPIHFDFHNLAAELSAGNWYVFKSKALLDWKKLPVNAMQVKGNKFQYCYQRTCINCKNEEELENHAHR